MYFTRTAIITGLAVALALPGFAQTTTPRRGRSLGLRRPADRGYLGVGVADLTDDRVKALNLKDDTGVEVKHVDSDSAASKAGLKEGDVILEVNGKAVENIEQFIRTIGAAQPGTKVDLTVWRNGGRQTLTATLDSRPFNPFFGFGPNPPVPPLPPSPPDGDLFSILPGNSPRVGFEGEPVTGQLAAFFGVREGVLVRSVAANTPADKAGLKAGDIVTKVNGTPVTSPREITGLVRASRKKTVSFSVVRNKKEMSLDIEVAQQDSQPGPDRLVL
jgi:serine protease Do